VQQLEVSAEKRLHERYRIDGVPTLVIADDDGVVQQAFLGPVTSTELWSAVAATRSDSAE
jgi:protein-disulfide isomerase-like protein with CxxC motif